MINLYCSLIINKRRTFNDVPEKLQEEVSARLKELGYDNEGNPLKEG